MEMANGHINAREYEGTRTITKSMLRITLLKESAWT